jgi:hypothetical protein
MSRPKAIKSEPLQPYRIQMTVADLKNLSRLRKEISRTDVKAFLLQPLDSDAIVEITPRSVHLATEKFLSGIV